MLKGFDLNIRLHSAASTSSGPHLRFGVTMVTVSVLFLLLSAFSPPVHSRLSTFQIIPSDMNQTAARAACRENYIDLVTVYSDEDYTDLHNMTEKAGIRGGWIGLYRSNFSEKWSNGDPVTFRNLAGDCGTSSCCATMKADGSWESLQCTETRYFMCYEEGDIKSKPNYHLILERETWSGAQRYCRGNYTDLVSIRDQQQNEEVKIKGLNSTTSFWIGLLCDDWQWTDGGNSAYRNWGSGHPQPSPNDCVKLFEGKWYSAPCSNNHYPLCYSISIHVSDEALSWEEALDYCREGNRAGILNIDSESEQEELESELRRRRVPPGNLWVGLGPNRLSEMKVSSGPLTCEDVERQTEPPLSHCAADTHAAEAAPDYVMDSAELRVVCKLK
ncbi:macrophage mannose receptor 1 [Ictalurus punctatus]|uniref:Macrophage mannose receptor 1 n=1 Tax=Ictalurus punctatus TaxID=7998 RepID=A0A2D0T7B3_ICTPU|nr:macrophage mannose receptor 1 [Ictalurus punctatus]